jgi:hypothetical protein
MRVLSLDISSSTGWALYDNDDGTPKLTHGSIQLEKRARDYAEHPWGYWLAAKALAQKLMIRISNSLNVGEHPPLDAIVVEETNGARNRFTQKFLEYCHFAFIEYFAHEFEGCKINLVYLNTSEWRKVTDTHLSKEEKNQNARLSRHKRKAIKGGTKLNKKDLGIAGKVTIKHVAIRRVKELYGIDLLAKQDDEADAILLLHAYINGAKPCTGSEDR